MESVEMYILEHADGYDYSNVLAVSSSLETLRKWKRAIESMGDKFEPAKTGQYFSIRKVYSIDPDTNVTDEGLRAIAEQDTAIIVSSGE